MSKKPFYVIAVLSAAMFAGCSQPNPTPVQSTWHKHEGPSAAPHSANSTKDTFMNRSPMDHNPMNHGSTDHSQMNHSAMQSAPNAAAQPFDLQFLDTMIAHHEGAVEMVRPAATKAANAEIKTLAAKIVADQEREIAEMKHWREAWFAGKPSALNMQMAGMADSMKGMDTTKMNAASGAAFDAEFVNQMMPHHQGALLMAREALTKAEHAELKTLANQIIAAQEAEIKLMQSLKIQ